MLWESNLQESARCFGVSVCFPPGIMQKVRRWLIESEDSEILEAETAQSPDGFAIEAIVDGLVQFSEDEDVVAQWTSFLFLPSWSQR